MCETFLASFAAACGISDRVHFIEGGKAHQMMDKSLGVVVLNSTMGISALRQGKPVYCVGTSIYAMPGLAVNNAEMPLDAFWSHPREPEAAALRDFEQVLKTHALVNAIFIPRRASAPLLRGFCKGWAVVELLGDRTEILFMFVLRPHCSRGADYTLHSDS